MAAFWPVAASSTESQVVTVSLQTRALGSTAFAYLNSQVQGNGSQSSEPVGTRHPRADSCGYWSHWVLIKTNAVSRTRYYGVFIYDSCNNDQQVFPVTANPLFNSCNNDDRIFASARYSMCPYVPKGTVPAGQPFSQVCGAFDELSVSLNALLSPPTYDPSKPTHFDLATSFTDETTARLSEATCTDVLDWQVTGWSIRWPEGADTAQAGSGHQGITASHTIAGDPTQTRPQQAEVTVVAHLRVTGRAYDIDDSGNLVVTPAQTRLIDVSNQRLASGIGVAPTYSPPQLQLGATGVSQQGDGSIGAPDRAQAPVRHLDAIRGRLLEVFPAPIVVQPGSETIGGVEVGRTTTRVLGWSYLGGATDAPAEQGTPPAATGPPAEPITVQYDHAERLDAARRPVDEQVPIAITVRTTWPDGHTADSTVSGTIGVTIYYVGLDDRG